MGKGGEQVQDPAGCRPAHLGPVATAKPLPLRFGAWPLWEMFAATFAFSAWTLALPKSPFAEYPWYSSALSGVAVLVASTVLGLLAPFVQHELRVKGRGPA